MNDWESPFDPPSGPAVVLVDGTAQLIGVATLAGITGYLDPHLGWFPGAAPAVSAGLAGTFPAGVTSAKDWEMNDWESPFDPPSGPGVVLVDGTAQLIGVATLAGMTGYLDPHLGWFPGAAPAVSAGLAGTFPAGVTSAKELAKND
jgi:hypothetical protein